MSTTMDSKKVIDFMDKWTNDITINMENTGDINVVTFANDELYKRLCTIDAILAGYVDAGEEAKKVRRMVELESTLQEWKMLNNRALSCGLKLSPAAMMAILRFTQVPGDITIYVSYIAYLAAKRRNEYTMVTERGCNLLSLSFKEVADILGNRIIKHSGLMPYWNNQKIAPKERVGLNDNMLDYVTALVLNDVAAA